MRTTLTLDDDVAAAIEQRRREHRRSLKQEVNELIRVGLQHVDEPLPETPPFRVEPFDCGGLLVDVEEMGSVLEMMDLEEWRKQN
jgi:plasmid stability protein